MVDDEVVTPSTRARRYDSPAPHKVGRIKTPSSVVRTSTCIEVDTPGETESPSSQTPISESNTRTPLSAKKSKAKVVKKKKVVETFYGTGINIMVFSTNKD
jgi:hypothetical protein